MLGVLAETTIGGDQSRSGVGSLRDRRRKLGLTQEDFANLVPCSLNSVAQLERGYTPKRSQVLGRIESTLARIEAGMATVVASIDPTKTEATLASAAPEEKPDVTSITARPGRS